MTHKTLFPAAILVWFCALPANLWPQSGRFELNVGSLWINVSGYDEHVGDLEKQELVFSDPPMIADTRTRSPLLLNMHSGHTIQPDIRFLGNDWGIGIRGWRFSSEDSFRGQVTSPAPVFTPTTATVTVNTASMWRETLEPVASDLEASGYSPVDYRGNGGLDTHTIDFFGLRELSSAGGQRFLLIVGAKLGGLDTDQAMGFDQRSFLFDYFSAGVHWNNFITLESTAATGFNGLGPMAGVEAATSWGWLGVRASASQAVLIGTANDTGLFTDTDDITSTADPGGPFEQCTAALAPQSCVPIESTIAFSRSERTFVPVTEMNLGLDVAITDSIAVGGSGFMAIWTGAPIPPAFTISHAGAGPGLDWQSRRRTLVFGGVGVFVILVL